MPASNSDRLDYLCWNFFWCVRIDVLPGNSILHLIPQLLKLVFFEFCYSVAPLSRKFVLPCVSRVRYAFLNFYMETKQLVFLEKTTIASYCFLWRERLRFGCS